MTDQDKSILDVASIVLEIRNKIIGIKINLLRVHKKENVIISKKNLDHLRELLKKLASEECIKKILELINEDRLDEEINFTFYEIMSNKFYNE